MLRTITRKVVIILGTVAAVLAVQAVWHVHVSSENTRMRNMFHRVCLEYAYTDRDRALCDDDYARGYPEDE